MAENVGRGQCRCPNSICCLREVEMDEGHAAEGGWIRVVAEARVKLLVVV